MAKKGILSLNAMEKLMRKAGAVRVGEDAKQALAEALEGQGLQLSREAQRYAEHAGRKTITKKDIQLAVQEEH